MSAELYNICHRAIISRIRTKFDIPKELKDALLKSDIGKTRIKVMAENITLKIKSEPNWVFIDQPKLEMMIWSFTDWFIYGFKRLSDEKAMSHFAREAEKAEANKFKELDENGNGYIEELGVKVVDTNPIGDPNGQT